MAAGLAIFVLILAANEGLDRYQAYAMQERRDKLAGLEELAMSTLRGDISSVANTTIYIMSPSVHDRRRSNWAQTATNEHAKERY